MAQIGQFLGEILKRAGVDVTQATYADVLSLTGSIPDEAVSAVSNNLLDKQTAVKNPELRKVIIAEALDGIDAKILSNVDGLSDADVDEIKNEKSTNKKLDLLIAKKTAALETKIAEAKKGGSQTAEKALEELKSKFEAEKAEWQTKLQSKEGEVEKIKHDIAASNFFSKHTNLVDAVATLPNDIKLQLIKQKVEASGGKLVLTDEGFKLVDGSDNAANFYYNGKPTSFEDFATGFIADNKWIKVAEQNSETQQKQTVLPATAKGNEAYIAKLEASIEADNTGYNNN